jgi:hypothetical protein
LKETRTLIVIRHVKPEPVAAESTGQQGRGGGSLDEDL